jgi:hypothetical protein
MIPLTLRIAILDEHTRLACLQTDASPLLLATATISTAASRHIFFSTMNKIAPEPSRSQRRDKKKISLTLIYRMI